MPFKYTIISSDKIVFTRLNSGYARAIFIVVGSIFTIIGISLIFLMNNSEIMLNSIKFLFSTFGLIAIYVGIKYPSIQSKITPDEIIFDNQKGRIEVNQKNSEVNTAYIYYDEIDNFIIQVKRRNRSNSTTSTTGSSYTYHVYLLKKDGGQWELLKRNSEGAALEEINKIKEAINFSATPVREPIIFKDSKKYNIFSNNLKAELSWRNKLGYGPLVLGLFTAIFIIIFSTIIKSTSIPIFAYIVIGFIFSVFVSVIGWLALKMIKNAKTDYSVYISETSLSYIEKNRSGGIVKDISIPYTKLHSIAFSFDSENNMRNLYIYTHEQYKAKSSIKLSFSLHSIMEMYNFYKSLIVLEIQNLTAVEALYMENYLQQQIKEIGKIEVA